MCIRDRSFNDQLLHSFYTTLPKKGRLSYNSKHMKPYRRQLNLIIRSLLQDEEIGKVYEQWLNKVEMLDDFQNTLANEKISHFKKTELDKPVSYTHLDVYKRQDIGNPAKLSQYAYLFQ